MAHIKNVSHGSALTTAKRPALARRCPMKSDMKMSGMKKMMSKGSKTTKPKMRSHRSY